MIIGQRLKSLREEKKLSQGDIEEKTGLHRCYISRVENGHTIPNVETLEKFASALEVPLYRLFYQGENPLKLPDFSKLSRAEAIAGGYKEKDSGMFAQFRRLFGLASASDRKLLFFIAGKMARYRPAEHFEKAERP